MTHSTPSTESEFPSNESLPQQQQFHVLLIEDSEDEMLLVKYALEECGNGRYSFDWENTLTSGKERLREGGVDLVLLDLGLPGHTGPSSFLALRHVAPDLPIVVLTSDAREHTELSVMTSGAEDFLIKEEISPVHLLHAIRGAISRQRYRAPMRPLGKDAMPGSSRRGHTIAFVGAKGGVGTTTTVLNLAAALAPSGSTIVLETAVRRSGLSLQIHPERTASLPSAHPDPSAHGLAELLSPTCFGAAVMFEPLRHCSDIPSAVIKTQNLIQLAERHADFVLVDAGSDCDAITETVMAECQSIILVVDREYASFAAVRDWTQRFMEMRRPSRNFSLLVVDRSASNASSYLDRMQLSFSFSVVGTVPNAGDQLAWALEKHRPLVYLDRGDPYSVAMEELTGGFTEKAVEAAAG